eukprot:146721_1
MQGIKYTHLMILIMVIFMMIFIIDRFTMNIWPLYFTKASPIEHDITATTFFIICWIMGRELIVASSIIWLLQCKCMWNMVFENKPKWLIVDDIMIENNYLHFHLGWFGIGVPIILHAWLVFFPLFQKHELHIYLTWWRPIDPTTNFYLENCHKSLVNISINDIYSLLISTIIFLVLFPLALHHKFRKEHYILSHYLHIVAATLYGIELLRTPFTAHCWYICTPFIILYIIDRFLGTYRNIGDLFWINTKEFGYKRLRPSHPFTTFYNHQSIIPNNSIKRKCEKISLGNQKHKYGIKSNKFPHNPVSKTHLYSDQSYELVRRDTISDNIDTIISETIKLCDNNNELEKQSFCSRPFKKPENSNANNNNNNNWNVGFLIRIHSKRNDKFSFTQYIKNSCNIDKNILTYGPYRSSFANIINEIDKEFIDLNDYGSIVLIATGAGASYIIDFMLYLRSKIKNTNTDYILKREIRIHFSCRSIKLFQFITDFLCEESIDNVHICAHLTSHKNVYDYDQIRNVNKIRKAKIGRASFHVFLQESQPCSKVFFCGHPMIQRKLSNLCQQFKFTFFEGHSFH